MVRSKSVALRDVLQRNVSWLWFIWPLFAGVPNLLGALGTIFAGLGAGAAESTCDALVMAYALPGLFLLELATSRVPGPQAVHLLFVAPTVYALLVGAPAAGVKASRHWVKAPA